MAATMTTVEELDIDRCLTLLERGTLGRLAFLTDGQPDVAPINYRYHAGAVVFRTGRGRLLDIVHLASAAFEVDGIDEDGPWSVVVRGRVQEATVPEDIELLRSLPLRPMAPGERDHYVRILPRVITGRRLR